MLKAISGLSLSPIVIYRPSVLHQFCINFASCVIVRRKLTVDLHQQCHCRSDDTGPTRSVVRIAPNAKLAQKADLTAPL